ncbi:MAG: M20 family metallopeptidase [Planctomycetota bacterium]
MKTDRDDFLRAPVAAEAARVVKARHDLHRIPEPGLEEVKTSAYIRRELDRAGIRYKAGIARTGIVAEIRGAGRGPGVLLRADIDGLAIPAEATGLAYASRHPGYMHACGHDAHAAMLISAARVLQRVRDRFSGRVVCVFQPAEEGKGGGREVVRSGAIDFSTLAAAAAIHVWGALPANVFGWNAGPSFAFADEFWVDIIGRGGHGSAPSQTLDPIAAAAQAVTAANAIISRRVSIHDMAVISICALNGGSTFNVIPDRVAIKGTVRTLKRDLRERLARELRAVFVHTARAAGLRARFTYDRSYPLLINDTAVAERGRDIARSIFGPGRVREVEPTMGGEDFSFFLQKVPGAMFRLGSSPTRAATPHHNAHFDIDERVLPRGVEFLCRFACSYLKRG